jgi:lipoprotein-releasing system ATP-binding protein
MNEAKSIIECHKVGKSYQDGKLFTPVLKDFDLKVAQSETLALVGASGCGKSTLLHLMGGLDEPTSGQVLLLGHNVHRQNVKTQSRLRNRYLGFVYQFHHLLPEFSAQENTAMPLLIGGSSVTDAKKEAKAMLQQVELSDRLEHRLSELSGGERQRVAIARALVTRPQCLLADEPTGNIDHKTAESIYQLLLELHQHYGMSYVVATHDRQLAQRMNRVIDLEHDIT